MLSGVEASLSLLRVAKHIYSFATFFGYSKECCAFAINPKKTAPGKFPMPFQNKIKNLKKS